MLDNMKLGLIILLTGIVVVFSVLVLLIIIIKVYSTAVSNAQNSIEAKKVEKMSAKAKAEEAPKEEPAPAEKAAAEPDDGAIPGEVIAAIAAAVEVIFGEGAVSVTSVRKARVQRTSKRRSAWKAAGVAENTRAF